MRTLVQSRSGPSHDDDLVLWIDAQIHLREQRRRIAFLLKDALSMRASVQPFSLDCYQTARYRAASETGLDLNSFPAQLPYSVEQILDDDFIP